MLREARTLTQHQTQSPQFFLTAPSPCPYVEGQFERKVFTHLVGDKAPEMNDLLTQGGFRRSQNIAYRPACESCRACVSVRILANEFKLTRNMRKVVQRNADLIGAMHDAEPSTEQFSLFRAYLDSRHRKGGMSDMTVLDYAMMVEDTHVDTKVIEYRKRGPDSFITGKGQGELIAVALTDKMADGVSMVYSYYNPELADRSLGTFMILDHIARTRALGLPHVYLGYWVNGSRKMDYKVRFAPQEHLGPKGWERFSGPTD
jgi:arginyl-tRNA--protein-N-Asp/Glu arginylyltransferase